jgi:hypothetical protein
MKLEKSNLININPKVTKTTVRRETERLQRRRCELQFEQKFTVELRLSELGFRVWQSAFYLKVNSGTCVPYFIFYF